jgi:hypothetical protein
MYLAKKKSKIGGIMRKRLFKKAPKKPYFKYPTYVATFTATGPGVICEIEIASCRALSVSNPLSNICCFIIPSEAQPPPKEMNPSLKKMKTILSIFIRTFVCHVKK